MNYRNSEKPLKRYLIATMLMIVLSSVSCGSKKPATTTATAESRSSNNFERKIDSIFIYIHDSVFVKVGADTVWKERYKTIYRDKVKIDTVVKIDSVMVDTLVTETVETNVLRWWQKWLIYAGIGMVAIILWNIVKLIRKI